MSKFLVIAALHGDEKIGVDVMKKIEKELNPKQYGYDWVVGNPLAYNKNIRYIDFDLNRTAPGKPNSKIYEEKRAHYLTNLSKKYSFVLDIHGTVADSGIVTIITYPTLANLTLASLVKADKNVIWYSRKSANSGPVSQHTYCPAIEIECGPKGNPITLPKLHIIIKSFIKEADLTLKEDIKSIHDEEFYTVYGKREGVHNSKVKDFKLYHDGKETYYPFLSNQYPDILCYKTKKFDLKQTLIYDS